MPRRPLDALEESLGALVTVTLKEETDYVGRLVGFDQHMNVVLEDASRKREDATTPESSPNAEGDPVDSGEETETVASGQSGGDGGDTIVIRGDNVVTITP